MHVTADFDGRLKLEENGLVDENVASLDAEASHLIFSQVHLLAGAAPKISKVSHQNIEDLSKIII